MITPAVLDDINVTAGQTDVDPLTFSFSDSSSLTLGPGLDCGKFTYQVVDPSAFITLQEGVDDIWTINIDATA